MPDPKLRFVVGLYDPSVVSADTAIRELYPINVRTMRENFTLDDNKPRYGFTNEIDGDFTFGNTVPDIYGNESKDYDYLDGLENSGDKCRSLTISILRYCGAGLELWKVAQLHLVDGDWDKDKCLVTAPLRVVSPYTCFDENLSREINLFDVPFTRKTAKIIRGTIELMDYSSTTYSIDDPAEFGGQSPASLGWKVYRVEYFTTGPAHYNFYYAREVVTLPCATDPGPGWILQADNCPTDRDWARFPILGDYTELFVNNQVPAAGQAPIRHFGGDLFAFNVVGDGIPGEIDNGILLRDILSFYASNYCGLTVKSDFFQINPDDDFPTAYPDLDTDRTDHVDIIFQKSDVKRPGATNNATKATTTLEKLIFGICEFYNLLYLIDENGNFRIEHCSWFARTTTIDLTQNQYKRFMNYTRRYSYLVDRLPKKEIYKAMEAENEDFVGLPIEYVGDCVTDTGTGKEKPHSVTDITTDVEYCLFNSASNSNKVSDSGLVMMCCKQEGDDYFAMMADPIIDNVARLNNVLSWAYLHDKFHRHDRLQKNGYLNGAYTVFTTTKPIKKRDRISIKFCCTDSIDLNGIVETEMGDATIGGASFRPYEEMLDLDLLYQDTIGNNACLRVRSFTFIERSGDDYTFNTLFEVAGSYTTEIQVLRPDATTFTRTILNDTDGNLVTSFPEITTDGAYGFRKRVICGLYKSEWSDFVTVNREAAPTCAANTDTILFTSRTGTDLFTFSFNPGDVDQVQAEIHRPDGVIMVKDQSSGYLAGIWYRTFNVWLSIIPTVPEHGLYRFRFRRVCDPVTGLYGPWTAFVDVNT